MSWACSTGHDEGHVVGMLDALQLYFLSSTHHVFAANPAAVKDVKADELRQEMSK